MLSKLSKLRDNNPGLCIRPVRSAAFSKYGRIVDGYDFSQLIEYADANTCIPVEGNIYVPDDKNTHSFKIFFELMENLFGEMQIQIGYCNGRNTKLNALEYHRSSEINAAVTDCVLLLASVTDIFEHQIDSRRVNAFYIRRGEVVELYSTTLHFSPCSVEEGGFKMLVILPEGTNLPLSSPSGKDPMLWKKNKWLMIHREAEHLKRSGAYEGITGDNIEIRF